VAVVSAGDKRQKLDGRRENKRRETAWGKWEQMKGEMQNDWL
jgi:hypothetical protein